MDAADASQSDDVLASQSQPPTAHHHLDLLLLLLNSDHSRLTAAALLCFAYGVLCGRRPGRQAAKAAAAKAAPTTVPPPESPEQRADSAAPPPPILLSPRALVVDDLLRKHEGAVRSLLEAVRGHRHFDEAVHDDLFLLRYVLSYPKPKAAIKALTNALDTRAALKLDACRKEVMGMPGRDWCQRRVRSWGHLLPAQLLQPDANGALALYVDARDMDMHQILTIPRDDFNLAQRTTMEFIFQRMDRATRSTGAIIKYMRIVNLSGVSLSKVSPRFVRRDAEDNKELQPLYPQLLGAVIFVNPPSTLDVLYRTLLPLLPKKITEKTIILSPLKRKKDLDKLVALTGYSLDELPAKCGGAMERPACDTSEFARSVAEAGVDALVEAIETAPSDAKQHLRAFLGASDRAWEAGPMDIGDGRNAEGPEGGFLWWSSTPLRRARSWWSATGRRAQQYVDKKL